MINLREFIIEKFKVNKDNAKEQLDIIDYSDEDNIPEKFLDHPFPDNIKKRFTKDKKELLWYKLWKYLAIKGITDQDDENISDYKPLFYKLNKENIVVKRKEIRTYKNGCLRIQYGTFLEAMPISKWKL